MTLRTSKSQKTEQIPIKFAFTISMGDNPFSKSLYILHPTTNEAHIITDKRLKFRNTSSVLVE